MTALPPYTTRELISERLPDIFPEGTPNRNYCVRELSASTIFAMLYIGAIENAGIYLGPVHVYRMSYEQAALSEDQERINYRKNVLSRKFAITGKRWYADNTREPIRDESLREGLVQIGAVTSLSGIPTTSSKPRYCLKKDFAQLFDPELVGDDLAEVILQWQKNNLSKSALTRLSLASLGHKGGDDKILVSFPNGETRKLSAGPSSEISKAVIENFAKSFLEHPIVLWLSTSDDKVVARDDEMAAKIGLKIEADRNLPDIILVDIAPVDPLVVFIEVVATDGAISERRQHAIYELTDIAGFKRSQITFVTAYLDRESTGFKKTISGVAWNSFVWFVSEPEKIIILKNGSAYLSKLIDITG
jgi:hypothetical protein